MRGASGDGDLLAALPTLSRTFGLGEVRDRTFLVHGLMNRNWRVETAAGTYAVKEITDVPLPRMRRNLAVLADLAGEGFPVPEPLTAEGGDLVAEVGGRGYCVLPWVEGDHVPGTELALDQARDLGALLARLHDGLSRHGPGPLPVQAPAVKVADPDKADSAAVSLLSRLPANAADDFDRAATVALQERRTLLARHAGRRPTGEVPAGPYGWTHGDLQYRNMLREGGDVVAVLDWDRLAVRPYGEEVARTAQVQFGVGGVFDLDRVAAFTAGYRSVIGLSEADLAEAVTRLWWKRMTDFWQLELYLDRQDPAFRAMFLSDEALLHWWTDRADEVQVAYATR
ncbi:phosphotransferase [Streptomyces sp. NBC_01565]|uniref:phosphotransferase n=1 Tax=unclassified Streptomyces TaxID=2593676 RepID=UPI00225AE472|nr:phosphotransferase [Streptomyces sp. NBC_01565]MCX4546595.1 phosphotransferase [Streptomyces sp. NBC_01565]